MSDLNPREQKILSLRFGLEDGVTHTLEEVGRNWRNAGTHPPDRSESSRQNPRTQNLRNWKDIDVSIMMLECFKNVVIDLEVN